MRGTFIGGTMAIVTRLDGRSLKNNHFHLVDEAGFIHATVVAKGEKVELEVRTAPQYHLEKANGFRSDKVE